MVGVRTWFVCLLSFLGLGVVADACTVPLPQPPMWVLDEGMQGGKDVYLIGVELGSLFEPDAGGTTCACGLAFSSPLPFGSMVTEAFVAVTDRTTHDMTLVDGFNFAPDPQTENGLEEEFVGDPQTEEIFDWFGLATTAITSVEQPVLGANEALKLWFRVEVDEFLSESELGDVEASHVAFDPDEFFSPENLTFAAGSAESDGTPIFTGNHAMTLFTAVAIPEPSTLLLAVFAGLAMIGRKRQ